MRSWGFIETIEYGFSPNTVFVPRSSVATEMEYGSSTLGDSVLFVTLVIHNERLDAFRELVAKAGYSERFVYHDQGYAAIAKNFHNYKTLAQKGLLIGISVYGVIALLFLLLYPGFQTKAVRTMESLGASRCARFAHIMLSSLVILFPASVLGGALGTVLWQYVAVALKESADTAVALQLHGGVLVAIAAAQFAFAIILNAFLSLALTAPKGLASRRRAW